MLGYSKIKQDLLLVLLFILSATSFSSAQIIFQRTYGGSLINEGRSVQQTLDGGYIIAGSTSSFGYGATDVLLIKTDSLGNAQFMKTYGGPNIDIGYSVLQLSDSGYAVAGYTNSFGNDGYDGYLVRTDKNGDTLWTKTYGGADWDFIYSLKQTSDGGFVMAGNTYSYGSGGSEGWIVKTDSNGVFEWSTQISIPTESVLNAIIQTPENDYVATGYYTTGNDSSSDILVVKLDSFGDSIWSRSFRDTLNNQGTSIDLTNSGDYIIGATVTNVDSGHTDFDFLKLDTSGNNVLEKEFTSSGGGDFLTSIHHLDNGGYTASGWTHYVVGDGLDYALIMTDSMGENFIGRTYGCLGNDLALGMNQCNDKGFIIVGESNSFGPGIETVYVIKTDSLGINNIPCDSVVIAVKEFLNDTINMICFPNPAKNFIYLSFGKVEIPSNENTEINILNLLGQNVYSLNLNSSLLNERDFVMNVENLESGYFLLSVVSDSINFKRKILISR